MNKTSCFFDLCLPERHVLRQTLCFCVINFLPKTCKCGIFVAKAYHHALNDSHFTTCIVYTCCTSCAPCRTWAVCTTRYASLLVSGAPVSLLMLPVFIWTFCFSKVVYVSCIYPLRCQQSLWFCLFEFWQKWNHCSLLLRLVCYCFQVGRSIQWCIGNKFINLTENNGKLDELY